MTKKLAYLHEFFNSFDDYQKNVDSLKRKISAVNCKISPRNGQILRINHFNTSFNVKNGEDSTKIYLKSDVLLPACVFEKLIRVLIKEYDFNPLYCVSLLGYTWQCDLKKTDITLQTLQDKALILLLESIFCAGISSVMGDRYVKLDETKNILSVDAIKIYGWAMSESLLHYEFEMWKGHLDCFMNKSEDIIKTP